MSFFGFLPVEIKKMDAGFKRWMEWWGMEYSRYSLISGDFLDPAHKDTFNSATIIFVNNLNFDPTLDNQLEGKISH